MNKEYRYRSQIRWGQYIIPIVTLVTIVLLGGFVTVAIFMMPPGLGFPNLLRTGMFWILAVIIVLLAAEGSLGWFLFYRMAGIRVSFENDVIVYKYRRGEKRIKLESITAIKLSTIPYLGGWMIIISGKEKIRLTVVLEEIGDFIQTLKASLDRLGLSNRYNESKLFLFLKTAVLADQSWDRIYSLFWKLIFVAIGNGLIGFLIASIFGGNQFFWIILYISAIYPILVYLGTEIAFARRIAKTSVKESFFVPKREIVYENSVYKKFAIIGGLIYFAIAILILFLR